MSLTSVKVFFRVRVNSAALQSNTHHVFLTGNCVELGNWSISKAVALSKEKDGLEERGSFEAVKLAKYDNDNASSTKNNSIWSTAVEIAADKLKYRYFIGCVSSLSNQLDDVKVLSVHSAEATQQPRQLFLHDKSNPMLADMVEPSVYGYYDGLTLVDRGWLGDGQWEIHVRLCGTNSVKIAHDFPLPKSVMYYVRCSAVDLKLINDKSRASYFDDAVDLNEVATSNIDGELEHGSYQLSGGETAATLCTKTQLISFRFLTRRPQDVGFQIDIHEAVADLPSQELPSKRPLLIGL